MTMTFDHVTPWTEEEYLALGETSDRVELFDGSLLVSPSPTFKHQRISRRLANILESAIDNVDLEVVEAPNIRLRPGRIPIPDVVLIRSSAEDRLVGEASDVALVCEITSPSNPGTDRVTKMHYYAEAGIGWYLLVDPDPLSLQLFRLENDKYSLHAAARLGEVLRMAEPLTVEIDPADLERRR